MGGGSFGFPEMRMAQIHKGHAILEIATEDDPVALGIIKRSLKSGLSKLPLKWQIEITGFSRETLNAKVNLAKRVKEKKGTSGQQVADLQRELK
jgi:ribosomal protein L16/L10AE